MSYLAATLGLGLAGVIGFYGWPVGPHYSGAPAPADVAGAMRGSGPGDLRRRRRGHPARDVAAFEAALAGAGVDHRMITYPDAPHSFFDRKATDFAEASAAAWAEMLRFVGAAPGS